MKRFAPLPAEGFCRDHQAYNALGMSRSKWWQGVKDGDYPQPVRHGRLTLWKVSDIRRLIDEIGNPELKDGEAA